MYVGPIDVQFNTNIVHGERRVAFFSCVDHYPLL